MDKIKINKECRLCKNKLEKIINIGPQPLANQFLNYKNIKKYPLNLARCKICGFYQLIEAFNTKFLFSNYKYYSPENKEVTKHHSFILKKINNNKKIFSHSKILEIGSNNCSFLDLIKFKYECFVLGIDPAKNLAFISRSKKINNESFEFNYKNANKIKKKYGNFDFIILRHVFAHIDNLKSITKGINILLKKRGIVYIENAYALNTFQNNEFDQIYHEHMSYLSLKPLIPFFNIFKMRIYDAFTSEIHGGSISFFLTKESNKKITKSLKLILKKEEIIYKEKFIYKFINNIKKNKEKFTQLIRKILKNRKIIATYGASAKGNTLLNYFKIKYPSIRYAFDNTSAKINKYLPGIGVPVISSDSRLKFKCNYIIITAWNFAKTIIEKELKFLRNGGKFIIPNPLKIISFTNYKEFVYKKNY
jgi:2-polyprenyl-3-methyl-5-hydroxy-6-metoxy-1,4-benzoquinol methylase